LIFTTLKLSLVEGRGAFSGIDSPAFGRK